MDLSTSECSSGCESGWTVYFDQYSDSADQCNRSYSRTGETDLRNKGAYMDSIDQEEDEDLSMVSDASSGPPHFQGDDNCFAQPGIVSYTSPISEQRKSKQKKKKKEKEQSSYLDDTASSPIANSRKHVPGYSSQGLSATSSKEKSTFSKHLGFLKSSVKGKTASEKSGGFQGRKW